MRSGAGERRRDKYAVGRGGVGCGGYRGCRGGEGSGWLAHVLNKSVRVLELGII